MFILSFSMLLVGSHAIASPDGKDKGVMETIRSFVVEVKATSDDAARAKRASDLAAYIAALSRDQVKSIDSTAVGEVASLLEDNYNGVKHFAAIALGGIGPGAVSAIPALEKGIADLEREEDAAIVKPSMPAAIELYIALHKIDGRPLPNKYMPKK